METKALEKDFQKPMDLLKKRRQYYRSINVRIATVRVEMYGTTSEPEYC